MIRPTIQLLVAAATVVAGAVLPAPATAGPAGGYEAESAVLSGGATIATDHSGYTGSGFVAGYTDANKGAAATTFAVDSAAAGAAPVTLRYANGTGVTMTLSLYAGGGKLRQLSLPATANWDSWGTVTEAVPLVAGSNSIAFRFDSTDSGNVNLDSITVAPAVVEPAVNGPELEKAFLSGGATVASATAGFAGSGYVTGLTAIGSRVIRSVSIASAGAAATTLRYHNSTGTTRTLGVYANGVRAGQVSLPATTGWSTVQQSLPMRSGLNLVGYQVDSGDSGDVALDSVTVERSAAFAARGATVPYTEYEAENSNTNGTVIGPDRTYRTVPSESSGRRAVRLDGTGQYAEFTLTQPAGGLVVRYSIPDNPAGTGMTAPLALYADGTKVKDLTLTSAYSWVYGNYPFPNDPALGGGHRFFDEVRTTTPSYPAGTVLRLQNETATPITVDLIDTEQVPAALGQPANSLDITAYGATPGAGDDTAAVNSAIGAAKSQGKSVWIPAGTFDINARINLDNVTVRGAGMWHSVLRGTDGRGGFIGTGNNIQLADFTITGDVRYREPDGADSTDAAIRGNFGTGSLIHNIWVEHTKVGLWVTGGTDGLYVAGVRIRDTFADGVNLNDVVRNTRIDQSVLRNTGDDALAMWSHTAQVTNSAFTFNTAALPALANTAGIYGGNGNRVEDNLFSDTVYTASGVTVSSWHAALPFEGTTTVQRNTLTRTGGWNNDWNSSQGAIWIYAEARDITAPVLIKEMEVLDSTYQAILLTWQRTVSNLTFDQVRIDRTGTWGIEILTAGSATFNYVTVSGATSGGLNNTTGFTVIRGPGNSGF